MAEVIVREEIDASVDAVWDLMSNFGGVADTSPMIERCDVEGDGVGAVRTLHMQGGLQLKERLEAFDPAGRTWSYSIVEPSPLPFKDYVSTVTLSDAGGRCAIEWRSTFEPDGAPEEQARKIIQGIYTGGIAAARKALS